MPAETDSETKPVRVRRPFWKNEAIALDRRMARFLELNPDCKVVLVQYDGIDGEAKPGEPLHLYSVYVAGRCVRVALDTGHVYTLAVDRVLSEQPEWRDAVGAEDWPIIEMAD